MNPISSNPDEKIIPLWVMVFDQDPAQAYLFTNKAKVFASVEGLVRSVAPDEMADNFVTMTLATLNKAWGAPFIFMKFQNTQLFVHRLEIDKYNPIHQVLIRCRLALESGSARQEAIESIDKLLVDPVVLSR